MCALLIVVLVTVTVGCTDAKVSKLMAYGDPHHIRVFSGGVLVGEWTTTGAVLNEDQSDGYVFRDAATQQMVRVSGEVIITLARPAQPGVALPDIPFLEHKDQNRSAPPSRPKNPYR